MADEKDDPTSGRLQLKWLENNNLGKATRSRKNEDRIASKMGGRRLPGSGGKYWSKYDTGEGVGFGMATDDGDLATPEFLVEHKRTDNKSISIKREWLDKVRDGATRVGKDPALVITFERPAKPGSPAEDWIVMPLEVARRVLGYDDGED